MIPYLTEHFGNPASRSHAFGWKAEEAVEEAREQVAALVRCDAKELVWTSGATESINLALKGAAEFYKTKGKHLITVKTEHKATLDTHARARAPRLRSDLPRRAARRPARPEPAGGGDPQGHDPGVGDVREQRNRRHPGHRRDRRTVPRQGRPVPRRCRAGHRQVRHRPAGAESGPDVLLGAQDLRPEGHRRALRAPQAARAPGSADARRRPRARLALRHAGHAPDRRHGRGLPPGEARNGGRERAHPGDARQAARRHEPDGRGVRQRRPGAPRAAQPEPQLQFRRRRVADHGGQGHRGVLGLGLHLGVARAVVRAARAGALGRAGAQFDPLHARPLHHAGRSRLHGRAT